MSRVIPIEDDVAAEDPPQSFKDLRFRNTKTWTVHTLDDNLKTNHMGEIPLDHGRHQIKAKENLGALTKLPPELLDEIFSYLDLKTMTDFRRVNNRAMQAVNSFPPYEAIVEHDIELLRASLAIEVASYISATELYTALTRWKCQHCDEFAGFIYLPTAARVCYHCLASARRYGPIPVDTVEKEVALKFEDMTDMLHWKSVTGAYGVHRESRPDRNLFWDRDALRLGIRRLGFPKTSRERDIYYSVLFIVDQEDDLLAKSAHNPIAGRNSAFATRFMAAVNAGWLDLTTKQIVHGWYCYGCTSRRDDRIPIAYSISQYNEHTFEKHMREFGPLVAFDTFIAGRHRHPPPRTGNAA